MDRKGRIVRLLVAGGVLPPKPEFPITGGWHRQVFNARSAFPAAITADAFAVPSAADSVVRGRDWSAVDFRWVRPGDVEIIAVPPRLATYDAYRHRARGSIVDPHRDRRRVGDVSGRIFG